MKITKRNGTITLYDDEKVAESILRANAEVEEEILTRAQAHAIADEVFHRLTNQREVITTREIRDCVSAILRERTLIETAEHYMSFRK